MKNHKWPTDQSACIWSEWMQATARKGSQKATQYRMCIHPDCTEVQYRDAPIG